MKKLLPFSALFTTLISASFVHSQSAPTSVVVPNPAASYSPCIQTPDEATGGCPTTTLDATEKGVNSRTVNLTFIDNPATTGIMTNIGGTTSPTIHPDAQYKVFWVWGDGNFTYENYDTPAFIAASRSKSHTYEKDGVYNPVGFATEWKSNDEPPRLTRRKIKVTTPSGGTAPTASRPTKMLNDSTPIHLFFNHKLRPKFPTTFAISFPAADPEIKGVYFFYNCLKDDAGNYSSTDLAKVESETVAVPDYFENAGGLPFSKIRTAGLNEGFVGPKPYFATFVDKAKGLFQNVIRYNIKDEARKLSGLASTKDGEMRIFPILQTTYTQGIPKNPTYFLAMTVGNKPLPGSNVIDISKADLVDNTTLTSVKSNVAAAASGQAPADFSQEKLTRSLAKAIFGLDSAGVLQIGDTLFIRSIAAREVMMVGSHDPNIFEIKQICPLENGKYRVTFRLEVCNEGYLVENLVKVVLTDFSNKFGNFQITSTGKRIAINNTANNVWELQWADVWDNIPEPSTDSTYYPQCQDFTFTMETDWDGIQKLAQGDQLQTCVTFNNANNAPAECHFNAPIFEKIDPKLGYQCKEGGWCCGFWCILSIIFGFLLMLLLLLKKKIFDKK